MKGHKIPDETRKEIYDRIAAGDKIAAISLTGVTTVKSLQLIVNNRILFSWPAGSTGGGGQNPNPLP